jgi:tetratricopeptide (TPR) repeat protein
MGKLKREKIYNIGLVMIVKNESHCVTESLESIRPYIDYYVISDTGSTDNTIEIITEFFEKYNIPGKIYHDEWSDFGTNRSKVLEHARNHIQFAWMLDADDLVDKSTNTKQDLEKALEMKYNGFQVGMIENEDKSFFYWRTQIFNLRIKWRYEGILHEYPRPVNDNLNDPKLNRRLDGWRIISRRLGNRNKMGVVEKYKKDAEILLDAVQKNPLNTRNIFYLANSYRDCKEYEKAVFWYQRRADFGGWHEEVFFSLYMAGRIQLFFIKNEKEGIKFCLKAYQVTKKRAESIHTVVQYMKQKKTYDVALLYNQKIKDITVPEEDGLFIETDIYETKIKEDYSLLSFLNFKYKDIILKYISNEAVRNDVATLMKIPSLFIKDRGLEWKLPEHLIPINKQPVFPEWPKYRVFNPSIAYNPDDGQLWINIRCTNFDDHYRSCDSDGLIHTVNYLCTFDGKRIYKMVDKSKFFDRHRRNTKGRVLGYEDIRLFYYNHHWCFLANNDEITGYIDKPQMVFGRLASGPSSDSEWDIEYVVHLQYPFQQQIEKNWVPLVYDNHTKVDIVYSSNPFILLMPDFVTGLCTIRCNVQWTLNIQNYPDKNVKVRNSSPYIPFCNGFLGLCHVVYFLEPYNNQRLYYSLFVYISDDVSTIKYSDVFHLEEGIIEFVNGICIDPKDPENIIISYSICDRIPKTKVIAKDMVKSLLHL